MRIGIVGNSHLGALKSAMDTFPELGAHEVTFWGMPSNQFKEVVAISDITLQPDRTKSAKQRQWIGCDEGDFDATNFDAVVVYAQTLNFFNKIGDYSNELGRKASQFYSSAVKSSIEAAIFDTFAFQYGGNVRRMHKIPVILHLAPFLSADVKHARKFDEEDGRGLLQYMSAAADELDLILLQQPNNTIQETFFSDSKFSTKRKNKGGKSISDHHHKTAEFGKYVLNNVYQTLGG